MKLSPTTKHRVIIDSGLTYTSFHPTCECGTTKIKNGSNRNGSQKWRCPKCYLERKELREIKLEIPSTPYKDFISQEERKKAGWRLFYFFSSFLVITIISFLLYYFV